ncbi:FIG4 [Candida pseudojiufengensis]|uniref:FIG4 n=1 Tax=Candida pseudojiufengensis TaxID=497109 RepID=UPI0022252E3E|nr:FIG4 [Candida pseudojiufengensis]KAI5965401.1 FIG4 [Candida pseudojiufengensis]
MSNNTPLNHDEEYMTDDGNENDSLNDETNLNGSDDDESNHRTIGQVKASKRILLQRFTIYNSFSTMYIVGSNAKETLYRIMEIGKDDDGSLSIVEDKNYFYTRKDMIELLNGLNESIEGGIHKLAQGHGLLGLIKFTKEYYLNIITKCSQVAILGGHFIYHIDETKLIPLGTNYRRPEKYSDEEKLLSIFRYLDLSKTFYFSYNYDITNSMQTNFMRQKLKNNPNIINELYNNFEYNERFVWNNLLLKPILENEDVATYEWFQPIIHGFIDQANISIFGKKFYITIIARRSHHFAGARFLKRGMNDKGNVANEIETEQIVGDMLTSSFHDPKYGLYNNPRYSSYIQHRGSIPLFWTQDMNKLPKPPIQINLPDPFYQSSALHFNDLFFRYGSPIIILNLIKQKEKQPREMKLNIEFQRCIKYLNNTCDNKLIYYAFDMSKHSKKNLDVITPLQNIAEKSIAKTGIFLNGTTLENTKLQKGIIRTNCIDCLDRTNAAQFIICKEVLNMQLSELNIISNDMIIDYDSDLINILTEMFHDHGDTIAIQYGGSNLVNTMDSYRRINQWSSHTRDMLNSIKRIYSNSFIDSLRQEAINLFLGNYIYSPNQPKLWELSNDNSLHNSFSLKQNPKKSYLNWYNKQYLNDNRFKSFKNEEEEEDVNSKFDTNNLILNNNENNAKQNHPSFDPWFNEVYIQTYTSFDKLFEFNMNSNLNYFIKNDFIDFNPFQNRKYPSSNKDLKVGKEEMKELMNHESNSRTNKQNLNNNNNNNNFDKVNPKNIKSFITSKIKSTQFNKKQKSNKTEQKKDNEDETKDSNEENNKQDKETSSILNLEIIDENLKLYKEQDNLSSLIKKSNPTSSYNSSNITSATRLIPNQKDLEIYLNSTENLIKKIKESNSNSEVDINLINNLDLKKYYQYINSFEYFNKNEDFNNNAIELNTDFNYI